MEKVLDKDKCTGCTACFNVCPKGAIEMIEDSDGFKYPVINQKKCINCGLCKKTCPVLNTENNLSINECYLAYNTDEKEILTSSSGAIFPLLADYILKNDGIVIGAILNNAKLKHIAITKNKDLDKLKGSKYLQSDLGNIFTFIKERIKDKKILFVGTPCQVAGLKSFIKQDFDNLYCIDLVCHGVPTPKLFSKYIKELEDKNNSRLKNYNFRDKSTGWRTYSNAITFENKTIVKELASKNEFMNLFLSDNTLRESCYDCNFKLGNKYSDITLGDFWGVERFYPEINNSFGISAVIINTEKGKKIFNQIVDKIEYKHCKLEEITSGNTSLVKSALKTNKRKDFFRDLENKNINYLNKHYMKKISILSKIKNKLKK